MGSCDTQVIYEHASPDRLDPALVEDALTGLNSVPGRGALTLVLSGNLARSVKDRLPTEEANAFDPKRVTGAVGAKVLDTASGRFVVVDARLLAPNRRRTDIDVKRLLTHEAWHLALQDRGEDHREAVKRLGLAGSRAYFLSMAVLLLEDFRVERALSESGQPLAASYEQTLGDVFAQLRAVLRDAVTLRKANEPIDRTFESSFRAFNSLATHFAYLAADHLASDGARTIGSVRVTPGWARYVGSNWESLLAILEETPSAAVACIEDDLDETAERLEQCLRRWFNDVGFDLRDLPDSDLYFDVLRHDFA